MKTQKQKILEHDTDYYILSNVLSLDETVWHLRLIHAADFANAPAKDFRELTALRITLPAGTQVTTVPTTIYTLASKYDITDCRAALRDLRPVAVARINGSLREFPHLETIDMSDLYDMGYNTSSLKGKVIITKNAA